MQVLLQEKEVGSRASQKVPEPANPAESCELDTGQRSQNSSQIIQTPLQVSPWLSGSWFQLQQLVLFPLALRTEAGWGVEEVSGPRCLLWPDPKVFFPGKKKAQVSLPFYLLVEASVQLCDLRALEEG